MKLFAQARAAVRAETLAVRAASVALATRVVVTAAVAARLYENWASSCTKTGMEVWSTGAFDVTRTTWNRQPAWSVHQDSAVEARGYSSGCPAASLEFTVQQAVAAAASERDRAL